MIRVKTVFLMLTLFYQLIVSARLLAQASPQHSYVNGRPSVIGSCQAGCIDPSSCCAGQVWEPRFFFPAELDVFFGLTGSKQPQDFGVNANLGVRGSLNFSNPLFPAAGVGVQIGSAVSTFGNAVQVFESLGESTGRTQSFTTLGIFQRLSSGFSWGVVYDYLYQESFDDFSLGQYRLQVGWNTCSDLEFAATFTFASRGDQGEFNDINVRLDPIEQFQVSIRKYWPSGVNTAVKIGVADRHSEDNVVTGTLPPKSNQLLFGADLYAPLTGWLAIYGETNLMMPADTGAVDAFLGMQFSTRGITRRVRRRIFRPYLPVAGNPTFTVDLNRR